MSKFQVGDKVVLLNTDEVMTITEVTEGGNYRADYDDGYPSMRTFDDSFFESYEGSQAQWREIGHAKYAAALKQAADAQAVIGQLRAALEGVAHQLSGMMDTPKNIRYAQGIIRRALAADDGKPEDGKAR
jgi:uncharacterized protein YodC (DUF2158 family)